MKILLTGGGSGGHFYPVIAVAQAINQIAKEEKLAEVHLFYMAPQPYDRELLFENKMTFVPCAAGKSRRYFSLLNYLDMFKTAWGAFKAVWKLFWIYPDVVFGKGGYVSFPALFAARFLRIPVVIHESDSVPGRVNAWAGKFAQRVAVSYPDAAQYFKPEKVAFTGNPVRQEVIHTAREGAHEFLKLDNSLPLILILGGSQGSQIINETIIDALPQLLQKYQVYHQTGENNLIPVQETAKVILQNNPNKTRYHAVGHVDSLTLRMLAGIADVIISRAGSTIFEIAVWGVPAILIPISSSNGNHQHNNAYSYAREGGGVVIEENNLTGHILSAEVERIMTKEGLHQKMVDSAKKFARTDAAHTIAKEIVSIALSHEK
ncbi:MAG: UDP-N-acetylglucosamine--N-acetylmuramyl-(pentapeptide) pyrophosphoryl-undecaprenol N-acetylglucosamine transferase [Patescibacteria group bacterium]